MKQAAICNDVLAVERPISDFDNGWFLRPLYSGEWLFCSLFSSRTREGIFGFFQSGISGFFK